MTNKTITLPREVGEMILRNRDRLGSGIIDPVRAALADPVPPAGVEPEVLARVCKGHVLGWGLTGYLSVEIGTELVDRAHVTRLQAEVERLRERVTPTHKALIGKHAELIRQRDALQAELTKARELLRSARASVATHNTSNWSSRLLQGIDAFLSNQSAPADKGGDS